MPKATTGSRVANKKLRSSKGTVSISAASSSSSDALPREVYKTYEEIAARVSAPRKPLGPYWKPRNEWEQQLDAAVGHGQEVAHLYFTDDQMDDFLLLSGIHQEKLAEKRRWMDEKMGRWAKTSGGEISCMGKKPGPNSKDEIHIVSITDAGAMAVRFFDGGLKRERAFVADFYDTATQKSINSPAGWIIHISPVPGTMGMLCSGPLKSWGGTKHKEIPLGEERFRVPERSLCYLERPGHEPFWFESPARETEYKKGVVVHRPVGIA